MQDFALVLSNDGRNGAPWDWARGCLRRGSADMARNEKSEVQTHFAPAARATDEEIRARNAEFLSDAAAVRILEALPDPAMILNDKRQIVAVNRALLDALGIDNPEELLGLRPGEMVGCIHSCEMPGGCGTAASCEVCGALRAILGCITCKTVAVEECRICTRRKEDGGALDVLVHARWISLRSGDHAVVDMRDISAEKRRRVLEKVFFHDVVNTASGIRAIAELMRDRSGATQDDKDRYQKDLCGMAEQIIEEIVAQRELLAAEQGELQFRPGDVRVPELIEEVVSWYRHHSEARGRTIIAGDAPDCTIVTDKMLLRRCLGNLIKNALEATPAGGEVSIRADKTGDSVAFTITNPGAMPEHVQQQVFQRSFSTKDGNGHGIGTYSVKLFAERYLKGTVGFTSREPEGTSFTLTIPGS